VSRVTNRVGVETLRDLLEGARTAALAYVDETGAVQALPAAFHWREGGGSHQIDGARDGLSAQ
jgi:hypothetical protein